MSSPRNRRLICPDPVKEMIASKCSYRSPCGDRSLHGCQFDVRERRDACFAAPLFPSSRLALPCIFHHSKQHAPSRHILHWWDEFRFRSSTGSGQWSCSFGQSAEPCAAPPTSPFMALLIDPLAVKAQARLPRFSSVCGCITHFSCEADQSVAAPKSFFAIRSLTSPATHSRSRSFNSAFPRSGIAERESLPCHWNFPQVPSNTFRCMQVSKVGSRRLRSQDTRRHISSPTGVRRS